MLIRRKGEPFQKRGGGVWGLTGEIRPGDGEWSSSNHGHGVAGGSVR